LYGPGESYTSFSEKKPEPEPHLPYEDQITIASPTSHVPCFSNGLPPGDCVYDSFVMHLDKMMDVRTSF
jgi:hypothetical protein